ncbi:hypothetical protein PPACK8108_LOCUS19881 [Phakopsora pachyrhizi]|uniref:Cytochrome b n=1 Tax=Phakopsora pachyrhizi TaxID=170000 RepID=A0AAV0BHE9_PHAPC|nr:hypothetical protein PPACK8108_LOCUS19881 [Phakopsora pachyrhizi]
MRNFKTLLILGLVNLYIGDSPQPSNIRCCLIIQIITGVTLAMHYTPSVDIDFISVEHIIRDHHFFIFVYLHIGRGLYYGLYKSPRTLVWAIGVIILIVIIATAFIGYVLPVSNATLNRFFSIHFVLPFIIAALAAIHLLTLHEHGSSNPLGVTANADRLPIAPYIIFKDLVTIFIFFLVLAIFVMYAPNLIGHSDNYIPANPIQTPVSIVPEWYLLPFYAILQSIPNKLLGVIAIFVSLLILLAILVMDMILVSDFVVLMYLGSQHVEQPYIIVVLVPVTSIIENTLIDLNDVGIESSKNII